MGFEYECKTYPYVRYIRSLQYFSFPINWTTLLEQRPGEARAATAAGCLPRHSAAIGVTHRRKRLPKHWGLTCASIRTTLWHAYRFSVLRRLEPVSFTKRPTGEQYNEQTHVECIADRWKHSCRRSGGIVGNDPREHKLRLSARSVGRGDGCCCRCAHWLCVIRWSSAVWQGGVRIPMMSAG